VLHIENFTKSYERFLSLVLQKSGHPFGSFDEGLAAAWEDYKPRLRDHALTKLNHGEWSETDIGSGKVLENTIAAIEIQDSSINLTNNLVFWQNRFGHSNRDHRALLEAKLNPSLRSKLEKTLFFLFQGGELEADTFEELAQLTGGKYPLLGYLFFLKDMNSFMPIQPTGFDRAFKALGIDFTTLRQCNWENYKEYNNILGQLGPFLSQAADIPIVRLIDSHSFCWIFSTLLKQDAEGTLTKASGKTGPGHVLGGRKKSIIAMRYSVESTVRNSNGQLVQRTVKEKDLRMQPQELEDHISSLLEVQEDRCALTGIRFNFHGDFADDNLLPSLDRIDSHGHYEVGNLQVVCRFINFWKGSTGNEEFSRLLKLVGRQDQLD